MPVILYENCAMIVNNAKKSIVVDRDPNFDDMILVIDGERNGGGYELQSGKVIYVGATYSQDGTIAYDTDMGLCFTYLGDERFMEIGLPPDGDSAPVDEFIVISDSDEGDDNARLTYTVTGQSKTSITLTFTDNA